MSEIESLPDLEKQEAQFQEVEALTFDQVKRGNEVLVFTGQSLQIRETPDYEIKVTGIRKSGLLVIVTSGFEHFTARMPGSFRGLRPDQLGPRDFETGVTPNILKVANETEQNCLYFENPKDENKDRISRSMVTAPIRKILFKK